MKKTFVLVAGALALSIVSCKPTMDTKSQVGLKGTWTLTKVDRIGGDLVKVNAFDIADADCFLGSQWKFVSNNNSGTIGLTQGGDCPYFESSFKWSITPNGAFEFKFVDQGEKAKRVTTGYSLQVRNLTQNSFNLVDKFYSAGKAYDVTYHFIRN